MDALRTLEILITTRTPFIAIETLEEDRVEQALERVAQRLRIPLFVWTMTRGLRRAGALEPLYDTKEPLKALRNLSDLPNEGIYLDRKSTRLNSSHQIISYAVFCLKKKKKHKNIKNSYVTTHT